MPRWMRKFLLKWTARVVLLRKTVERSCPKPKRKRTKSVRRGKKVTEFEDNPAARRNGGFTVIDEQTSGTVERKDDGLVTEMKKVFLISKNLDYGGMRYANSVNSPVMNGHSTGDNIALNCIESDGAGDCDSNLSFTGVLDENGEELDESELAIRHWEWIMAARVLDRALLWMSIIAGIVTFLAIFMKAPRLQSLLFGS